MTKLGTGSWSLRTGERNELRSVEKSERFQFCGLLKAPGRSTLLDRAKIDNAKQAE
jgi:hypothetical protein